MRQFTAFFFLILFANNSRAQNAAIDSVNRLLKTAQSDTARINLTNEKIYLLGEVNLDSSTALAKKILEETKRIHFTEGEADALRALSINAMRTGDYNAAEKYLKDAEVLSTSLNDSLRIAKIFSGFGMMYGMQSKYDSSILFYQKAIDIHERLGFKKMLSTDYGNLAIGYQMQSNFSKALFYQQKSLKIAEERNDARSQAYTMMNMGSNYQNIGDTVRAEQALLKGIELAKSVGIKNVELYGYSNLASLYSKLNKFNESYKFAMKAVDTAKTMGDIGIESASYSKAGMALANMKEFDHAEDLVKKGMAKAVSSGQPLVIYQAYSTMGAVLKLQEKYAEAIPFLEKSINTLKDADEYDESLAGVYSDLSACYEKTGNYNKALSNFRISSKIIDSVRSSENVRKATELSMNYEFDKKQAVAAAIQEKKNAGAKSKQLLLLVGLGVTVIVAAGAWIAFRNKQKANRILELQKAEIQSTLGQLKTTQAQLIQSEKMASLGELTAGIAHEIQNPLNFVNNFSEVSNELLDEMKEELIAGKNQSAMSIADNVKQNLEKIIHHGKRADGIVKGMLQHSRTSTGQKELTDLNALTDEYFRLAYHGLRAKDKTFTATLNTNFDERLSAGKNDLKKINIVPQDIGRVLLNLFNNAFYSVTEKNASLHSSGQATQAEQGYEPTVSVSTKRENHKVIIRIKDNGNGISENVLDKIFQPFVTTKPTGEGTGLGLSMTYDIIKAHGGEINVETKPGEGAEFIISLPA